VFVPCIAIGELYFGAYKSLKLEENLARIDEFALYNTVLPCEKDIAKKYGEIKSSLKEKGQPIPENDIWIAAIAQQYALTLVTKNPHFEAIENLNIENWQNILPTTAVNTRLAGERKTSAEHQPKVSLTSVGA